MKKRVPKFIADQYAGGASGFRKNKRDLVRQMRKLLSELRLGCAYFPSGEKLPEEIGQRLDALAKELSVKEWGR